jgi:hypothetical protein
MTLRTRFNDLRDFILVRRVKLMHAWLLTFVALAYIAYAAPLALQPLVLVLGKAWIGALLGYAIDRSVFNRYDPAELHPNPSWEFRRMGLIIGGMIAVTLGV